MQNHFKTNKNTETHLKKGIEDKEKWKQKKILWNE